ncbi:MAG TPA: cupredoxin domain-containing protein [Candidatus Limnocylindria bacterium]|nr:cupredoxin domain-containing protein [Candidatus Limnocylindria bacterium]
MRRLSAVLLSAAFLAACSGEQAQPTAQGAEPASVSIVDLAYAPATLTVGLAQPINWVNDGAAPHTVTFEDGPDSGTLESGATFQHAFETPGTYDYTCSIHPAMMGVVNVGP